MLHFELQKSPAKAFGWTLYSLGDLEVRVGAVLPDSPAAAAGIKPGWQLAAVNGQACRGLTHTDVVELLETSGTAVQVDMFPDDAPDKPVESAIVTLWRPRGQTLGIALRSPPSGLGVFLSAAPRAPGMPVTPAGLTDILKLENMLLVDCNGMLLKHSSHDEVVAALSIGDVLNLTLERVDNPGAAGAAGSPNRPEVRGPATRTLDFDFADDSSSALGTTTKKKEKKKRRKKKEKRKKRRRK